MPRLSFWQRTEAVFLLFAAVKRYYPESPNVQLGIGKFVDGNGCLIESNYEAYFATIKDKLLNIDTLVEEVFKKVCNPQGTGCLSVYSIICGKYQFESLCRRLKFYCNKNINRDQFTAYLVSHFDLAPLQFLKEKILQLFSNGLLTADNVS